MKSIELINLALDEIRRAAQRLADVEVDYQYLVHRSFLDGGDSESRKYNQAHIQEMQDVLENCRMSLRQTMGDLIGYLGAHDMIAPVDEALSQVARELIYEHKTDNDYEDYPED